MPRLRIMSIYKQRQRTFAAELAQARAERERFTATLVARFGKEAAEAIRQAAWGTEDVVPCRGGMPKLFREISMTVKKLRRLDRKVRAVRKKIHTPDCWFREWPGVICVLQATGLSWRMVHEECSADGRLPISTALRLLKALRMADRGVPAEKPARHGAATGPGSCDLTEKWQQRLRRRRRRLAHLLRTAVMLEEDVQWLFRF